jgi:DNA-binding SARP family transcriptional activator
MNESLALTRLGLLGPLRAWQGENVLDLGPLQQRVVLAILALQAGRPISRPQVINAVWGETPPKNAVNLIQRHASGLRRALEPARPSHERSSMLMWTEAGYHLALPDGLLDLDEYEGVVARARAARASGRPGEAAAALRSALRLWRGPVCDGLSSPFLDGQRDRLAESRLGVVEERIELELATGDGVDLVAELRALVAEHPLREKPRGLLMLALYRAGCPADALAAFRDARRQLRDELGVEPGASLQRLHQQILAADPELSRPPFSGAEASAGEVPEGLGTVLPAGLQRPRPAQLPHRVPDFTGRDAELRRLDALTARDDTGTGDEGAPSVAVTVIAGTAGVGKTALAVHWAHRAGQRFPGGQLYVNLRGFDPAGAAMKPAEAIRGFLDALGIGRQQMPASLEAQTALYRSLLAGRRVLVLLDNAADEEQVRPLLPGAPGCVVIVTSRNQLPGLIVSEGARPVFVDLLSPQEARELLSRRLADDRVGTEPRAADDIIARCARLPLALMLVAARAATHPQFPLTVLAAELREAGDSLDAFGGADQATNARAVFSWSYEQLSESARELFRLLGLHFGPDIGTPAAASLAGLPPAQVRPTLVELSRAHLVTERAPGRYALHDLLRAYATEKAHVHDSEDDRSAARRRMLDHYLQATGRADGLLTRTRDRPFTLADAVPGTAPVALADRKDAMSWFTAEAEVLVTALRRAEGFDTCVWQLAWVLVSYLEYQGYWRPWRDTQLVALEASRRLADSRGQAYSHRMLGSASIQLADYDQARAHLQQALALFAELGDGPGQAATHQNLASLLDREGRYREALEHEERALALYQSADYRPGTAATLNAVGWFNAQLGDYHSALGYCLQAVEVQLVIGDQFGQATTYDSLGFAYRNLGQQAEAVTCYEKSAILYAEVGDRYNQADTLGSLGDAHQAFGDSGAARHAWRRALVILEDLSHPDAEKIRARMRENQETPYAISLVRLTNYAPVEKSCTKVGDRLTLRFATA